MGIILKSNDASAIQQTLYSSQLYIFDLDGTLYEDTDHFSYYAEQLKLELPENVRNDFMKEYEKMEAGDHIVTIGKVYDVVRDHILSIDSVTSKVTNAWKWDGNQLVDDEIAQLYPHPISLDFDSMIAIGDGWWLPNVCARHYGAVDTQEAYHKTKEFMATDAFTLNQIEGLREALIHLKTKKHIVLLTNSQPDDVERLLNMLHLNDIFDDVITVAKKPQLTHHHFQQLMNKYDVQASSTLSIGDNFLNEIAPALQLNMRTIFIDFYGLEYAEYNGPKVQSISNIIPYIHSL